MCSAQCGNGIVEGAETCDDQNDEDGDGCEQCQIVDGYECEGGTSESSPSVCIYYYPCVSTGSSCEHLNYCVRNADCRSARCENNQCQGNMRNNKQTDTHMHTRAHNN